MDVVRLMRALTGESAQADAKTVELRPGQVIRGVVLQLFADNEALLNMGGAIVRAKLETPIPVGQATLLQVQPNSGQAGVLLKPLAASTAEIAPESFADLLKSFGMKDTPLHRAVARVLHEEGAPMTRAANAAAAAALQQLGVPAGEADDFVRAAATALKRGLPVSAETVRALHTAMHGPAPSELHRALETGARSAIAAPETGAAAKQAASRLLELLQRADALAGETLRAQAGPEAGAAKPPAGTADAGAQQAAGAAAAPSAGPASQAAPQPAAAQPTAAGAPALPQEPAPRPSAALAPSAPPAAGPRPGPAAPGDTAPVPAVPAGDAPRAAAANAVPGDPQAASPPAQPAAAPAEKPPLLSLLKLIGVDAEREWMKLASASPPQHSAPEEPKPSGAAPHIPERAAKPSSELQPPVLSTPAQEPALSAAERAPAETLKSVLAQLAAADDAPPALKEAAQTALQSITGQQLLLAQDKAAPFAHVVMFVPLKGSGGDGDAAVHITARRGKKGELDAENCRLWFQLSLASFGETWVDVAVANKLVGLHVWNDHPLAGTLLTEHKAGVEAAMREIGYRLIDFKHSERPKERTDANGEAVRAAAAAAAFAPQTYKGVDLRI